MLKPTANIADADVLAKNEVHDGLGRLVRFVARPVFEDGVQEAFHCFPSRCQRCRGVCGNSASVENLEASFQLNFIEAVGGCDRSRGSKKGVAMFQGCKDSVAGAFAGSGRRRGTATADEYWVARSFSLEATGLGGWKGGCGLHCQTDLQCWSVGEAQDNLSYNGEPYTEMQWSRLREDDRLCAARVASLKRTKRGPGE